MSKPEAHHKSARPPVRAYAAWLANISAGLGLAAIAGVLCFHFPELLTSAQFREIYTEGFVRTLLVSGLTVSFIFGFLAIFLSGRAMPALIGVISSTLAVLGGGMTVRFDGSPSSPYALGMDWFLVSLLFSALVFVPMERLLPVRSMSPLRPQWRTDLAYFFMSHLLVQFLLIVITVTAVPLAARLDVASVSTAVASLPWLLQFVMAIFVADLFQATLHKAYHCVPWLWRFHAIHHSVQHMDWLAGSRLHIIDILLTRSVVLLPLLALGFEESVVSAYVVLAGTQAVLAHANLRFDFGLVEKLLVTPRYHHWHHAAHPDYTHVNFAIHLPLVDHVLGSHKLPPRDQWPVHYGLIGNAEPVPPGLLRQLAWPFRSRQEYPGKDGSGSS